MSSARDPVRSARRRAGPRGVLSVLQALVAEDNSFDVGSMAPPAISRALQIGLGPTLAYVTRRSGTTASPHMDDILAADLTARLLTAEIFDALEDVLKAANAVGSVPVLLKGCAAALRYYPEPHLRTMGDIDLLVGPDQLPDVESQLRALGFVQKAAAPAARYERHHHSMPFWHHERRLWVEVHTYPFPPFSPLAGDPRYSLDSTSGMLTLIDVGRHAARVMNHELQLVYTASRWSERLNVDRGVFPILDAALLLRAHGGPLDWDAVHEMVGRSWAATALRLMLGYLRRAQLAAVPTEVLRRLASSDRFANRLVVDMSHRLIDAFVIEGRRPGPILTRHNLRIIWSTLLGPAPPRAKLFALPVNIAFPPRQNGRFDPARVLRRMRAALGRPEKRD